MGGMQQRSTLPHGPGIRYSRVRTLASRRASSRGPHCIHLLTVPSANSFLIEYVRPCVDVVLSLYSLERGAGSGRLRRNKVVKTAQQHPSNDKIYTKMVKVSVGKELNYVRSKKGSSDEMGPKVVLFSSESYVYTCFCATFPVRLKRIHNKPRRIHN